MASTAADYGVKGMGPGILASMYTGVFNYSYVDNCGGDVVNFSRQKKHKLDDLPSKELLRAILMDSLAIVEYAIRDLVTVGELRKCGKHSSASISYTQRQLQRDLDWLLTDKKFLDGPDMGYTAAYCCEILDINLDKLRSWLLARYLKALTIARDIKSGKRPVREKGNKRRGKLHSPTIVGGQAESSFMEFFAPLE